MSPMSGKTNAMTVIIRTAKKYLRVFSQDAYTASIFLSIPSSRCRTSSSMHTVYPSHRRRIIIQMVLATVLVGADMILWIALFVVQYFESRAQMIPQRARWNNPAPFLYMQDWHTILWGDPLGLSLINGAAGLYLSTHQLPTTVEIALALGLGAFVTLTFVHINRSPRHRPDSGTPRPGTFSWTGKIHLLYFFVQASLCSLMFELAAGGALEGTILFVAKIGGVIYFASFLADWHLGRFAPLQK